MRLVIITLILLVYSCGSSNKLCKKHSNYLRKDIDTTKEYKVKGVYCVASIKDTAIEKKDDCIVKFNVFDRINGRKVENGVIYFYGRDTVSIIFNNAIYQKEIKTGVYTIEAWANRYIGTKTEKIEMNKNKKIEINFYLGTTVDF